MTLPSHTAKVQVKHEIGKSHTHLRNAEEPSELPAVDSKRKITGKKKKKSFISCVGTDKLLPTLLCMFFSRSFVVFVEGLLLLAPIEPTVPRLPRPSPRSG